LEWLGISTKEEVSIRLVVGMKIAIAGTMPAKKSCKRYTIGGRIGIVTLG